MLSIVFSIREWNSHCAKTLGFLYSQSRLRGERARERERVLYFIPYQRLMRNSFELSFTARARMVGRGGWKRPRGFRDLPGDPIVSPLLTRSFCVSIHRRFYARTRARYTR